MPFIKNEKHKDVMVNTVCACGMVTKRGLFLVALRFWRIPIGLLGDHRSVNRSTDTHARCFDLPWRCI